MMLIAKKPWTFQQQPYYRRMWFLQEPLQPAPEPVIPDSEPIDPYPITDPVPDPEPFPDPAPEPTPFPSPPEPIPQYPPDVNF